MPWATTDGIATRRARPLEGGEPARTQAWGSSRREATVVPGPVSAPEPVPPGPASRSAGSGFVPPSVRGFGAVIRAGREKV